MALAYCTLAFVTTLAEPTPSANRRRPLLGAAGADLLAILALLGACFAVYGQTLGFAFINFDDPGYVYQNPTVLGGLSWANFRWAWTTFTESNWHPLTWLSLMADAQLYGTNAGGYHLTNLLFHSANCVLLFAWLRRATSRFWPSLIVAFFFAVHPLHVESVAWVSERKDVLSLFFCLLTLLAYTRYAAAGGRRWYALALALFAAGLTAKPMLVTLPALLLLLDYCPYDRRATPWRALLGEKAPFLALAAAAAAVTFHAQTLGHAMVPYGALSMIERAGSACTAGAVYVTATFWPVNLGVYYPYWPFTSGAKYPSSPPRPLWQPIASLALLTILTIAAWRGRRAAPYAAVGWGWFIISLVPVIGLVKVGGAAMADRYTYLPHIGLFIAIGWSADAIWRRWPMGRAWLGGATAVAAAACLALGIQQTAYWKDGVSLFSHTFQITRRATYLCTLLGDTCVDARRYAEARDAYEAGLQARPGDPDLLAKLGYVELIQGHWAAAIPPLLAADRRQPNHPGTLCDLGRAFNRLGRQTEAIAAFRRCLRAHPEWVAAHLGLADALRRSNQPAEAQAEEEAALKLDLDCVPALNDLAWLLALDNAAGATPDAPRALALARRSVALTKGANLESIDALAVALAANGHWTQAAGAGRAAVETAQRQGAAPPVIERRRERMERYRAQQFPTR